MQTWLVEAIECRNIRLACGAKFILIRTPKRASQRRVKFHRASPAAESRLGRNRILAMSFCPRHLGCWFWQLSRLLHCYANSTDDGSGIPSISPLWNQHSFSSFPPILGSFSPHGGLCAAISFACSGLSASTDVQHEIVTVPDTMYFGITSHFSEPGFRVSVASNPSSEPGR